MGGAAGIALSFAIVGTFGTRPFIADLIGDTSRGTDIHMVISPDVLITATVILVFAGVLAGFWPAVRASRLDPIEALRYE